MRFSALWGPLQACCQAAPLCAHLYVCVCVLTQCFLQTLHVLFVWTQHRPGAESQGQINYSSVSVNVMDQSV